MGNKVIDFVPRSERDKALHAVNNVYPIRSGNLPRWSDPPSREWSVAGWFFAGALILGVVAFGRTLAQYDRTPESVRSSNGQVQKYNREGRQWEVRR